MHVLAIDSGAIDTGDEAVDLGQSPADVVVLSAADTELGLLARAFRQWRSEYELKQLTSQGSPLSAPATVRLANLMTLRHNYSVDLYCEQTLRRCRLVIVRLLGGRSYWPYGVERLLTLAREADVDVAFLPGDDKSDPSLAGLSTVADDRLFHLWRCLCEGGHENAMRFLDGTSAILDRAPIPLPPRPVARAGIYRSVDAADEGMTSGRAAVIFYRALLQSGDLAPIDAMIAELVARRLSVDAFYVASLKDEAAQDLLRDMFDARPPDVVLNATAFAAGLQSQTDPLGAAQPAATILGSDAPWLQVVLSGQSEDAWSANPAGLALRDIAMHVAMPEFDGRLLTRAVSFKAGMGRDPLTELPLTGSEPNRSRLRFTCDLAANWAGLRRAPVDDRRVGIVLANYPNRDGRIANGVGLATPESAVRVLAAMAASGYEVDGAPADDATLIAQLKAGPTNANPNRTLAKEQALLPVSAYLAFLETLPEDAKAAILARWGDPLDDPFVTDDKRTFAIAARCYGNVAVAIQPARGYNLDPKATYHDPALVPPHGYLAFYLWLRGEFGADAVIHLGKHGNQEWLPGKALALSEACWPEIALGPTPNIYPFIVNDPGEGAQAKRRASAVIIDHLMPPMVRAETYGPLKDLEALLDEYFEAQSVDLRRAAKLKTEILSTAERTGLAEDCGFKPQAAEADRLQQLDAYLCDLKELQIRGGLHVLGDGPQGDKRDETLSALVRVPRGDTAPDQSLQRAIAADLNFENFDPLDCDLGSQWTGPRPACLTVVCETPWRTNGDTVERIEILALKLIRGEVDIASWPETTAVLEQLRGKIAPSLDASGGQEIAQLLSALDGRFVPPGPSGAPTRGRPDVLPTGRNFYSLDSRGLPTPTAWELGKRAADEFVQRYVQDHGDWPKAIAMSAWGTSNMRTGGDDLAQALALMGAKPTWDGASRRVTGYEILPVAALGRPRVDVTIRVSGFFRDAFPQQIALIDNVVRAIAERDEPESDNPIRARALNEAKLGCQDDPTEAWRRATYRIFGSKPGAYGAGLQAMFDERLWDKDADLSDAFLEWGQYAYGAGEQGRAERGLIEERLKGAQAVLHNQDNREHDILDSDDYYQFAGGLAVASRVLKGEPVPVYHGDNSRPERPVVRGLEEEIARVVRARAANPKWIGAMMEHGYKGAFELAATVDYLFAFAATTRAVRDHHFEALYDAYIDNEEVRVFLQTANPDALCDIASRMKEALDRGLWAPKSNSAHATLSDLMQGGTTK